MLPRCMQERLREPRRMRKDVGITEPFLFSKELSLVMQLKSDFVTGARGEERKGRNGKDAAEAAISSLVCGG